MATFITASAMNPATVATVEAPISDIGAQTIAEYIAIKAVESGVDAVTAQKISYCESTWRQYDSKGAVLRGRHNPDDVGLFQINEYYHLNRAKELGYDIYSTEGNIDYALWLMAHEGIKHWHWSKPCWSKKQLPVIEV